MLTRFLTACGLIGGVLILAVIVATLAGCQPEQHDPCRPTSCVVPTNHPA